MPVFRPKAHLPRRHSSVRGQHRRYFNPLNELIIIWYIYIYIFLLCFWWVDVFMIVVLWLPVAWYYDRWMMAPEPGGWKSFVRVCLLACWFFYVTGWRWVGASPSSRWPRLWRSSTMATNQVITITVESSESLGFVAWVMHVWPVGAPILQAQFPG